MPLAARIESAETPYFLARPTTVSPLRTMWVRLPAAAPVDVLFDERFDVVVDAAVPDPAVADFEDTRDEATAFEPLPELPDAAAAGPETTDGTSRAAVANTAGRRCRGFSRMPSDRRRHRRCEHPYGSNGPCHNLRPRSVAPPRRPRPRRRRTVVEGVTGQPS
jgi:hypothetical protein